MFVYNLKNRQQISNPTSQIYTLKFISLEAIRDHQTRISQVQVYRLNRPDDIRYMLQLSKHKKRYY